MWGSEIQPVILVNECYKDLEGFDLQTSITRTMKGFKYQFRFFLFHLFSRHNTVQDVLDCDINASGIVVHVFIVEFIILLADRIGLDHRTRNNRQSLINEDYYWTLYHSWHPDSIFSLPLLFRVPTLSSSSWVLFYI